MGLIDKLKRKVDANQANSRLEEELIYKHIMDEMESGVIREGLFAKAIANSNGDEIQAKSLYMKYRLQSVKDAMDGNSYIEYVEKLKLEELKKIEDEKLRKLNESNYKKQKVQMRPQQNENK